MPSTCCVVNCSSRGSSRKSKQKKIKMFRFPADLARRDSWTRAVHRSNWQPNEYSRICSRYFIMEKPSPFPNHPDYIPSIFPYQCQHSAAKLKKLSRYNRLLERRKKDAPKAVPSPVSEGLLYSLPTQESVRERALVSPESTITDTILPGSAVSEGVLNEVSPDIDSMQNESKQQQLVSTAVSTEMTSKEISRLQEESKFNKEELCKLRRETELLQRKLCAISSVIARIGNDDKQIHFYTGLPSYLVFEVLLTQLSPLVSKISSVGSGLSLADELLLVLMKLARAITNQDLAYRFDIDCSKVTRIFHRWIDVMAANLKVLIHWPEKDMIIANMPHCFKPRYRRAVCVIDCSEVFIQRPTAYTARGQTYSSYKSHNTVKFLVATTPTGAISFISKCWGGRVSDKHLTMNSGLLKLLHHGDMVIADRGFDIGDELVFVGATLEIPPFTKGKPQLSQREVENARTLSRVRIHVERAIGRLKNYKVLKSTLPINLLKRPHETDLATIDKILITCAALTNLHPPLIT